MNKGMLSFHNGRTYWHSDYSHLKLDEFLVDIHDTTEAFLKTAQEGGGGEFLIFIDFTDSEVNSRIVAELKAGAHAVGPYTKKIAAIGVKGMQRVFANTIAMITGLDIKVFEGKEEAFLWLFKDEEES